MKAFIAKNDFVKLLNWYVSCFVIIQQVEGAIYLKLWNKCSSLYRTVISYCNNKTQVFFTIMIIKVVF